MEGLDTGEELRPQEKQVWHHGYTKTGVDGRKLRRAPGIGGLSFLIVTAKYFLIIAEWRDYIGAGLRCQYPTMSEDIAVCPALDPGF